MKNLKIKSKKLFEKHVFIFPIFIALGVCFVALNFYLAPAARAQSGGNFNITQSVIGSGGRQSSGGGFALDGTIGQALAGTNSAGGNFDLRGGFWTATFAPATLILGGRISLDRPGLMETVRITLQNLSTGAIHSANPSSFGYYRFQNLQTGSYMIAAEGGNFQFTPPSLIINLSDNTENVDFTGAIIH